MVRWKSGVNVARLLIGLVLFVNLQCAVLFLVFPEHYVAGFELIGVPGVGMVQDMGSCS